jgi:hypothetical protein
LAACRGRWRSQPVDSNGLRAVLPLGGQAVVVDAFCIGDVYGDTSFPPARGNEVFVADVLEDGELDESTAAAWLDEGRPILRDA